MVKKDSVKEVDVTDLLRNLFNKSEPAPSQKPNFISPFFLHLAITRALDLFSVAK